MDVYMYVCKYIRLINSKIVNGKVWSTQEFNRRIRTDTGYIDTDHINSHRKFMQNYAFYRYMLVEGSSYKRWV